MSDLFVRMVARQVASRALNPSLMIEPEWENYPEIGEFDWEEVRSELSHMAETLGVQGFIYDHSYAQLAARAEGVA